MDVANVPNFLIIIHPHFRPTFTGEASMEKLLFRAEDLKGFVVRYFTRLGVPETDARIAAEILIAADLRGVDSHGLIRISSYYGSRLRKGLIDPNPTIQVLAETPATLRLDGGAGLGQVVSHLAMKRCIAKAKEVGTALVTVRNSNHYGIAGYYAMMALEEGMIGISYTNAQPLVAPTYGRTAVLGTNPIAVAVPAGKETPYVLDMATSIVPIGRITVYQKSKREIPSGWGIDKDGGVTTDPSAVLEGGALMPLGGIDLMRGYKGYGLAMLVDIFSGVLSGAATATSVGHPGANMPADVGHFFQAIRIDAIRPVEEFKAHMDAFIHELKNAPKAAGQERIYIPGEKEFELAAKNLREGVPLMAEVVEMVQQAGNEIGVTFDPQVLGRIEV
jgi:LDH2 family malate/lactate/ureidoglycolate dehydrogenase